MESGSARQRRTKGTREAPTRYTPCMASRDLLTEALALPTEERARLAHELIASLDEVSPEDPAVVEQAWAEEIQRRIVEIETGAVEAVDWETVRDELRADLASRRTRTR